MTHTSLRKQVEELKIENERLQARVAELEWYAQRIIDPQLLSESATGVDPRPARAMLNENLAQVLNRTPAQSLASIKAQTLREYAAYVRHCDYELINWRTLDKEADRIEQEARGK